MVVEGSTTCCEGAKWAGASGSQGEEVGGLALGSLTCRVTGVGLKMARAKKTEKPADYFTGV